MAKITVAELRDLAEANPQGYLEAFGDTDPIGIAPALRQRMAAPAPEAAPESSGLLGYGKDLAISGLKGVIGVPEMAVGLADIPTMGYAGKLAEAAGVRFKDAQDFLTSQMTPESQQAMQDVAAASQEGLIDTAIAVGKNPRLIPQTIVQSVPSMLAGGLVGRGIAAAATPAAGVAATGLQRGLAAAAPAIGEGAVMAGAQAEQIRQQTADGTLTPGQAGLAAGTGIVGGAFGEIGRRIAGRLGIKDVDAVIAGQAGPVAQKALARKVLEGAFQEGVLEELPQSVSEQVLQNIALGKPLDEGVNEAIVLGTLAGAGMGAGAQFLRGPQPVASGAGAPPPAGAGAPPPQGAGAPPPAAPPAAGGLAGVPPVSTPPAPPPAVAPSAAAAPPPAPIDTPELGPPPTTLPPEPAPVSPANSPQGARPPVAETPTVDLENFGAEPLPADLVRAQLLAEQGYTEGDDGIIRDANGLEAELTPELQQFLDEADDVSADMESTGKPVTPEAIREQLRRRQRVRDLLTDRTAAATPEAQALIDQQIVQAMDGDPLADLQSVADRAKQRGDKVTEAAALDAIKKMREPKDGTVADGGSAGGGAVVGGGVDGAAGAGQVPGDTAGNEVPAAGSGTAGAPPVAVGSPASEPTAPVAPRRPQPGEPEYTLDDAQADLRELVERRDAGGRVTDDRLAEQIRRQIKLVKDMREEAEKADRDKAVKRREDLGNGTELQLIQRKDGTWTTAVRDTDADEIVGFGNGYTDRERAEADFDEQLAGARKANEEPEPTEEDRRRARLELLDTIVDQLGDSKGNSDLLPPSVTIQEFEKSLQAAGFVKTGNDWVLEGLGSLFIRSQGSGAQPIVQWTPADAAPPAPKPPKASPPPATKPQKSEPAPAPPTTPESVEDNSPAARWLRSTQADRQRLAADGGLPEGAARTSWDDLSRDNQKRLGNAMNGVLTPAPAPKPPKASPSPAPKPPEAPVGNKLVSEDRYRELRDRMKAKLRGELRSGIDPEILTIGAEMAVYHIENGIRKFAQVVRAIAADLGVQVADVKKYARGWYNGARDMMEDQNLSIEGMDDADAVRAALATLTDEVEDEAAPEPESNRGAESGAPPAAGGREPPAQQPAARDDSADVEAGQPGDVGATDEAGDRGADGVRRPSEDVGAQQGAAGSGDAGDGRAGDGGARAPDAGTGSGRKGKKPAGEGVTKDPDSVSPGNAGPGDFFITDPLAIVGGGQVARFDKNKAAIELRNRLLDDGRRPTREEQAILAGYTGWGSFGQELFQGTWTNPKPKAGWEGRDEWLRNNLGETEWKGAQTSIINAHYTDPPTVLAMWDMVQRLGFKGGRVLEPSIGIGNFYGMMPPELVSRSQRAAIELDPVTGSMAQMLYPHANVRIQGFQDSKTPDNFYDLVIGNWPFFESGPADRRYNRLSPTLHDYFFLKAIDQTRPGGLIVGITSKGTMDKKSIAARAAMARKAELLAAFRLPSGAFEEYAGTKVVTDILILRKRDEPIELIDKESWINVLPMSTPSGTPVDVNEYFHKNPSHVVGTINYGSGTTSFRPGLIVDRPADMAAQLKRIVSLVPEGGYIDRAVKQQIAYIANQTSDRTNSLTETKDGLFVVRGDYLAPANQVAKYEVKSQKETATRKAQLSALIKMRRLYGALIDKQRDGDAEAERKALRDSYEAFTKAYGPLNDSFGLSYMERIDDPFFPALAALESKGKDGTMRPAKILTESTTRGTKKIDKPSIADAFVLARNKNANPDLDTIAELAGVTPAEAKDKLMEAGAAYELPNGDFIAADLYLSGNVREKLRQAKAGLEEGNAAMQRNIDALTKVLPETVPYFSIETQLGATWVPPKIYELYVAHLLGIDEPKLIKEIGASFKAGSWEITFPREFNNRPQGRSGYGVVDVKFKRIVQAAIGNQLIKVKKKDSDGSEYVDEKATAAANDAIARIRKDFADWLWNDPLRRTELEAEYNEARNAYASPTYDGSFLTMEGMALTLGRGPFNLRKHQMDAIWRGIVTRKSLNAHEVGTGKTFTMGGIAIESRRYGIAKKPLLLAHNANSKSVAHEIQMMYPSANVLYIDNLSKENSAVRMMQIANDDWDAVVIPHSMIDRIGFKEETLMAMAQETITELEVAARDAAREDDATITPAMWDDPDELKKLRSQTAKQLVKQRQRVIEQIKKLAQRASREGSVSFEDLGIDMVIVDEAHEFKKPPIATRMKMKGLQTQTSDRSISLMFMTSYIRAMQNGGNVHLFTGTPITNTLTEVFHQMRYIMAEEMKEAGLADWDGWFSSFAQEEEDVELTSSGEYEAVTRLQNFINVPELRRMIGQYMDVVFADDMPEMQPRRINGKMLSDPDLTEAERAEILEGRTENAMDRPYKKVISVSADMSEQQLATFGLVQELSARWKRMGGKARREAMARGAPEVPIIHDALAEKASFDIRLVNGIENAGKEGEPETAPHPDSKPARVVRNLLEIYNGSAEATQVVFMEQGMSKSVTRSEGPPGKKVQKVYPFFSTMADMVERLVQAGVPREQIAVVTGATSKDKRKEIADAMNTGAIRIVFGSTDSLGVGVNMQRNLKAMHHMDAPWMPGELWQRNGRGHRQGNQWNTVLEFRYLTDRIDGRRWQILAIKQRFIMEFLTAKGDVRIIEGDAASDDQGDIMSTFAEAAGDPRVLVRAKYQKKLEAMQSRERLHGEAVASALRKISDSRSKISDAKAALEELETSTIPKITEVLEAQRGEAFKATINGQEFTDRTKANDYLVKWMVGEFVPGMKKPIGKYGDLTLFGEANLGYLGSPKVFVNLAGEQFYGLNISGMETSMRAFRDNEPKKRADAIQDMADNVAQAVKVAGTPFPMQSRLDELARKAAEIEADLAANPVAPPFWLRNGAPVDTRVRHKGKSYIVTGHRWTGKGYFVVGQIGDNKPVQLPYLEVRDDQGMTLYEPKDFKKPTVIRDGQPVEVNDGSDLETESERDALITTDAAGRPLRRDPEVAFNRGPAGTAVASPDVLARVESMVRNLTKTWARAPKIVVVASMQDPAVPAKVREADARQKQNGATGEPLGWIIGETVYINAGTANKPATVLRTIAHEVLGHAGLRGLYGSALNDQLKTVALLRAKDVAAKLKEYGLEDTPKNRLYAAEEVLARMAEDNPTASVVQRILAAVRTALRPLFDALGIKLQLSDGELIRDYIVPARRYIEGGGGPRGGQRAPAFSRPASRVAVDKAGRVTPLRGNEAERPARRGEVVMARSDSGWRVDSKGQGIEDKDVRRAQQLVSGEAAFNRGPAAAPTWVSPDETRLDNFIHALQDKNVDLKRIMQVMRANGQSIADAQDAYTVEELGTSRKAAQIKNFLDSEVADLFKTMQLEGLSRQEFEKYLLARHAREANDQIAKANPNEPSLQDGGSGMTNQDADTHLQSLSPAKLRSLQRAAAIVDRINQGTRDLLVTSGLEKAETIAEWEATYQHYVPLQREGFEDAAGRGTGQGISVKGSTIKSRMGSKLEVVDILANVITQRERVITRAENNRVGQALLGLAITNPNPDFWLPVNPDVKVTPARSRMLRRELIAMGLSPQDADGVAREPYSRHVNPKTGLVEWRINPALRNRDNVIAVRVKGKDRFIFFKETDPRAMRMATALKNLDARDMGTLMRGLASVTRFFAAINTQFNIIFGQVNFLRDVQAGLLNLGSTPISDKGADIAREARRLYAAAFRAGFRLDKLKGADLQLWQEFRDAGGPTGFRDLFPTSTARTANIDRQLEPDWWTKTKWGQVLTAGGALKVPEEKLRQGVGKAFDWISDYNQALENITRMAAYKVATDNGMTEQQSASLAKNLTANFNRRGAMGQQLGAWYAFFNASAQGTARIVQAVTKLDNNGRPTLTDFGKKVIAGGFALGVIQALALAGSDEEDPPQFIRERNLILPDLFFGSGKYLSIPMPLGWHVLPNFGRLSAELLMRGGERPGQQALEMLRIMLDAFNPLGSGSIAQIISPTAADPIVALQTNTDWTGRPIARKDFNPLDPTPGFTRGKDSSSIVGETIAYGVNWITGGTDFTPGLLSPTPDQIDYLAGQLGGGVAREIIKGADTAGTLAQGETPPLYRVPLVGRFVGSTTGEVNVSGRYYRNLEAINIADNEARGRAGRGEAVDGYLEKHPEGAFKSYADQNKRQVDELRRMKRQRLADGASMADVRPISEKIAALQQQLNDQVEAAKRR